MTISLGSPSFSTLLWAGMLVLLWLGLWALHLGSRPEVQSPHFLAP